MAETEQIIRLRGDENIHALRSVIARAQGDRVLLVVPRGHAAFYRLVRLKLLVRQAHDHGKALALVTRDPTIRDLAGELNLSVFRSVGAGQRARRWRHADGALLMPRAEGNGRAGVRGVALGTSLGDHDPVSWRTGRAGVLARRRELGRGGDWGERIALTGLALGLLVVLVAVLVLVVPSAEVTLVPRQEPIRLILPVTANPETDTPDFETGTVPAQVASVLLEATAQTPASGRKDVPEAHATGTVLFVNVTDQAIPVPAGTLVSTSSAVPVKFRTLQPVTVPAGSDQRAVAPIEAVQPGPTGNVAALMINQIEGPASVVLRVLNPDPPQGGTVKQAAVVTAADKEQLREQLHNRLHQEALTELQARTPTDAFFVPQTLKIETLTESFDHQVDEQTDMLSLLLRVRASGVVVPYHDIERLARRALLAQVQPGFVLLDEGMHVTPREVERIEDNTVHLAIQADGVVGAQLDGGQVRGLIRGQPLDAASAILIDRLPLSADPGLSVQPGWWPRLPYLPLRIFVRVAALPPGG
ncbi:MAG: baseplate J/gp47 family protein [Ardenticatenaceae bacterium]|nr:baseplate J/gp47 family protein [Ardenticatenaceae bacterium]